MANLSPYLSVALRAAKEAEDVINKYYSPNIPTQFIVNGSPVTIADKEAEVVIKKIILDEFPDHAFGGEENGFSHNNSEFLWIVDPIDGTKNYMRNIPLFGTQIALMKEDKVILGVSNMPQMQELIWAEKNNGAYRNNQRISVSSITELNQTYISYGGIGYFNKHHQIQNLLSLEHEVLSKRGFGDCWSYHLLGSGKIEVVVEAEVSVWDVAAISIIIEEAGGKVTDINGEQINRQTNSIIATNGLLHEKVLSYFR